MNRTVLITGGSGGIGRAIAEQFIRAGDDVLITGRSDDIASSASGLGATGVRLDLEDIASIDELPTILASGVDVIVNNAGGFAAPAPAADADLTAFAEYWHRNLRVNVVGAALVTRALEDHISPGGAVISIGSIGAEYAGNPYSASKAALQAWNAGVSERLGARGITANVVAPGYVEGTNLFGGPLGAGRRTALVERTHTKCVGKPEDIGSIVSFLASPKARHITGQTMHVNGGAHTTR
ncbi:SDR family oxidoreductase [uncultured Agrococcus sp.]|uniref:SDR family NAD(P)-dependent oxidoreductase n=1 Tax=uncultured Agrococcus sp. TaxID=382258 RepID=UPI0025F81519|nr:SDR family oxidoreductase [uncultured Agrococcus sp.]